MDLDTWKDIALLILTGIVAGLGIVDRRSAGKSKDAQINLLEARITQLKEEQTPEAVSSLWKTQIELAEKATEFANAKISEMKIENNKEKEILLSQVSFLTDNVKVLSGTISAGTVASTNISGSPLFQDFSKYIIKETPHMVYYGIRSNDSSDDKGH